MMYYLWMLHYALIKKLLGTGTKKSKKVVWNLSFFCIIILVLFVLTLLLYNGPLGNIMGSGIPLAPIGAVIAAILLTPLILMSRGLTGVKISRLRKIIIQTKNLNRIISFLYVIFFIVLYFEIINLMTQSMHNHGR